MWARAVWAALLFAFAICICGRSVAAINEGQTIFGAGNRHSAKPNIVTIAEEVSVSDRAIYPQTCFARENLRSLVSIPFEYVSKLQKTTSLNHGSWRDRIYFDILRNTWEFIDNFWYNMESQHFRWRSPIIIKSDGDKWVFWKLTWRGVNASYRINNEVSCCNNWQFDFYDGFCLKHCSLGSRFRSGGRGFHVAGLEERGNAKGKSSNNQSGGCDKEALCEPSEFASKFNELGVRLLFLPLRIRYSFAFFCFFNSLLIGLWGWGNFYNERRLFGASLVFVTFFLCNCGFWLLYPHLLGAPL